jgi:integrase
MRVRAKLSLDLRLYDATRHSVATQLRLAGVPLPDIKDQLGHSDIRTTMKYAHGDLEKLRGNLEKLSLRKVEQIRKEAEGGG